jgi:hypothetical protein
MNTREFQHRIVQLMKGHFEAAEQDDYFLSLKTSLDLEVIRDISTWWRCVQFEKYCVLTCRYLNHNGRLESLVRSFYQNENISPYIETASHSFLSFLVAGADDEHLRSLADFEDKLIKVRKGDEGHYIIYWKTEPYQFIGDLLQNKKPDTNGNDGFYRTVIDRSFPNFFEVEEV